MSTKSILFNGPMVRALLEGRKTQTRRIAKVLPIEGDFSSYGRDAIDAVVRNSCRYGKPGDLLWVRETSDKRAWSITRPHYAYKATMTSPFGKFGDRWIPSIHMPRWVSRLTLKVTDVRVQRLQDISEEDARAEGAQLAVPELDEPLESGGTLVSPTFREGFRNVWESINGPESWGSNPWVWALTFEVLHANIDDVIENRETA